MTERILALKGSLGKKDFQALLGEEKLVEGILKNVTDPDLETLQVALKEIDLAKDILSKPWKIVDKRGFKKALREEPLLAGKMLRQISGLDEDTFLKSLYYPNPDDSLPLAILRLAGPSCDVSTYNAMLEKKDLVFLILSKIDLYMPLVDLDTIEKEGDFIEKILKLDGEMHIIAFRNMIENVNLVNDILEKVPDADLKTLQAALSDVDLAKVILALVEEGEKISKDSFEKTFIPKISVSIEDEGELDQDKNKGEGEDCESWVSPIMETRDLAEKLWKLKVNFKRNTFLLALKNSSSPELIRLVLDKVKDVDSAFLGEVLSSFNGVEISKDLRRLEKILELTEDKDYILKLLHYDGDISALINVKDEIEKIRRGVFNRLPDGDRKKYFEEAFPTYKSNVMKHSIDFIVSKDKDPEQLKGQLYDCESKLLSGSRLKNDRSDPGKFSRAAMRVLSKAIPLLLGAGMVVDRLINRDGNSSKLFQLCRYAAAASSADNIKDSTDDIFKRLHS
ncbi:hypothetical protein [Piscirickettsia litoralis]|uniref:Uncharacterized protein n=1 Tax=Piscirickettsia litoralis TaxID=1891921 RepID=A0ABX2ZXZ1_9GAMM|nr:hypothetical protein [Piscirickettsia litoralis]ODN41447.1 hypothetical protein BGC07_15090 [Piscirickettsia litoralis]